MSKDPYAYLRKEIERAESRGNEEGAKELQETLDELEKLDAEVEAEKKNQKS